eukprot:tig00021433_g21289.t1
MRKRRDKRAFVREHWHDPETLQRDECAELRVLGYVLAFLNAYFASLPSSLFVFVLADQPFFVLYDCTVAGIPHYVPGFRRPDILIVLPDRVIVLDVDELQHGIFNGFAAFGRYLFAEEAAREEEIACETP